MRRDLLIPSALLVLGAALGLAAGLCLQSWKDGKDSKLRFIDYEVEISHVFPPGPHVPGQEVAITIDGKDASRLMRLDLFVYNFSDRDYENVPFYVELISADPLVDLRTQILTNSACGANDIPDSVSSLKSLAPADRPGVVRYGYEARSLNHTNRFSPSFRASYFLADSAKATLEVRTDKAGIELRRLQRENTPLQESRLLRAHRHLPHALALALLLAVLWIAFLLYSRRRTLTAPDRTPKTDTP